MAVTIHDEFFRKLGRSAGVRRIVDDVTHAIAGTARSGAPVDDGSYRDGIYATGKYQQRYVGLVIASDPASMAIESRTGNLARALRAHAG